MESSKVGADAKITVDYENQRVFITDLDHGINLPLLFFAGFVGGAGIMRADVRLGAVLIECALASFLVVPNIPVVQRLLLRFEAKNPMKTVTIPNPSGVIKYVTQRATPLIDFEYDDGVRAALKRATLEPSKGGHILTIEFLRPSIGEMVIKEY